MSRQLSHWALGAVVAPVEKVTRLCEGRASRVPSVLLRNIGSPLAVYTATVWLLPQTESLWL